MEDCCRICTKNVIETVQKLKSPFTPGSEVFLSRHILYNFVSLSRVAQLTMDYEDADFLSIIFDTL